MLCIFSVESRGEEIKIGISFVSRETFKDSHKESENFWFSCFIGEEMKGC